ncbi:LuxR family transcriptional regulator [Fodinibacter luteus]|uniref:LuxR family transcriptional regulator n=1 Tax=Fodinibacter luteus TaxID=552064 RepID=A0ABP8KDT9_9MICO
MSAPDRLVGREAELTLAAAALRRLGEGHAAALVVEGEAGIGKTELVRSIVEDSRAGGVTVFTGQAHPFERTRPFGVVAQALDLSRRSPDPRRAAIGTMLTSPREGQAALAAGRVQYRIVEDIVDLVEATCTESPVLLVAEDLHWADAGSLLALSVLARRLPLSPLLLVVTTRTSPVPAELVRLLEDLSTEGGTTVHLEPLGPDEVVALASRTLGAPPGPLLGAMLTKAGGNPLWATAVLRALGGAGVLHRTGGAVESTTSQLPASVGDLVVRRLSELPETTRELLQVTAVLGDAASVRDVAAVAHRGQAEVVTGLREAFDAQLLDAGDDRVVFRHQLVHEAIYEDLPALTRRLLHREAAAALMGAGAEPLEVADHLVRGAEHGDEEAVARLREAAAAASARAPLVTVDLLHRARSLLPAGHPDADAVSAELVQAQLRAGLVTDASTLAETLLARPHAPEVETPVRLALLGALALQNRVDEVVRVAEDTLVQSPGLPPLARVPVLAQQSWAHTYSGDHDEGAAVARRALAIAEDAGDAAMTVWALTALLVAVGRQGRYGEALAHAQRADTLAAEAHDTRSLPLQPRLFLGLTLFDCDRVAEARAAYREALDDEFGSGWWLPETLMADALVSFATGEWQDAVPSLVACGQAAQEKGSPLLLTQSLAYRVLIATARGDLPAARELATGIVEALAGDRLGYTAGILGSAVARLMTAEGDEEGALEVLVRCWRFEAARGDHFYDRCLAPDLVRLGIANGRRDVAAEVTDAVWAGVDRAPEVASVRSVALRCRGLLADDPDLLLGAVALARQAGLLVDHAGACEDAAGALAGHARRDEATALLSEALELYERAGADAWASRVRARLRGLGVHPGPRGPRHRPETGWESLTPTERAVSLLVAEGLTNGAVARRLYVSPHTVNTHLRHVFAKLGVSNRVALAGVVNRTIG